MPDTLVLINSNNSRFRPALSSTNLPTSRVTVALMTMLTVNQQPNRWQSAIPTMLSSTPITMNILQRTPQHRLNNPKENKGHVLCVLLTGWKAVLYLRAAQIACIHEISHRT